MVLVCFAVPQEARPFEASAPPGVRVLVTGMGKQACRNSVTPLLAGRPDYVLTCGFAGGLNPELPPGTVVYDADPSFPLTRRLRSSGAVPASFLCSGTVIVTAAEKARIRQATRADAVEMESGHIREWCAAARIPSATVRVILDAADEDLPLDFNSISGADQQIRPGKLAKAILQKPSLIPALMRLGKESKLAARKLAEALLKVTSG